MSVRLPAAARPERPGPSAALFALFLLYLIVAEANDLYSTLKLAAETGLGWRAEWNPLMAAIWRADGPGGLIVAKVAFTLVGALGCLLIYRLGFRRRATMLAVAYIVVYTGYTLLAAWQIVHTVVVVAPH